MDPGQPQVLAFDPSSINYGISPEFEMITSDNDDNVIGHGKATCIYTLKNTYI